MAATISLPCPTCGQTRSVRRRDAHRIKQCRRCHLTQIASMGYAATQAKYGQKFAVRFVREYRLAHPSSLEQIVMTWLDCQNVCYEREFWLEMTDQVYLVDFIIGCVAVEVQGAWVHQFHTDRDRRKLEALRNCGFAVVALSEADVLTGAFVQRLGEALARFVSVHARCSVSRANLFRQSPPVYCDTRLVTRLSWLLVDQQYPTPHTDPGDGVLCCILVCDGKAGAMTHKVALTIDLTPDERLQIEELARRRGYDAPGDYLLSLVNLDAITSQEELDFDTKEGILAGLRESWHEVMTGDTRPISELWDALNDE